MTDHPYAVAEWEKALRTAATHSDLSTRERADRRRDKWERVIRGLASGSLVLGSRTPVAGLPAWVTPDVVRGGFATGIAAASGPWADDELALIERAGLPREREALFDYYLSAHGLAHLWGMLDSGAYEVKVPENAALLVVAWLVRAGETQAAVDLVDQLRPFASQLRLAPWPSARGTTDLDVVSRATVADVAALLSVRRANPRVAAMNEALLVWNPFADKLLNHWLETAENGRVDAVRTAAWSTRSAALLAEYFQLSLNHRLTSKHRNPKENLAVLRLSLEQAVRDGVLPDQQRGKLQTAVDSMLRKRGAPGSPQHTELRRHQARDAALPTMDTLAHLVADRLAGAPQDTGITSVDPFVSAVSESESSASVPTGTEIPKAVIDIVRRAQAGTLAQLVADDVIPSSEILATFVPQITAQVAAEEYSDPGLSALVARTYVAFRRRRSLLLTNLEHQVRPEELPWLASAAPFRTSGAAQPDLARATMTRLAGLSIERWPGVSLPNGLIRELTSLSLMTHTNLPLTEELAADIFMGRFSGKFADAYLLAASVTSGSLYARYYRLDDRDAAVVAAASSPQVAFGDLARKRAATPGHQWCVPCNGMVIEQAQILTTHNLAQLVSIGLKPAAGWLDLATQAFAHTAGLISRLDGNAHPLRTLKDTSYAWRQTVFFASLLDDGDQALFFSVARAQATARPPFARERLHALLDDLRDAGRRAPLLGWTHGKHRLVVTQVDPQ